MKRTALLSLFSAIITLAALLAPSCASAQTRSGEKSFGPKVGFVSRNTSATAGLAFQYSLSRVVRLSPEAAIIFRHNDLDALTVDLNVHFPIPFAGGRASVYPYVGANFTSWGRHGIHPESHDDVTSHSNQCGINAGCGVEYYIKKSLKLSAEARYTLMRHYPTAFVTAGIAFVF